MFIHANWDVKIKKKKYKYIFVKNTLQAILLSSSALRGDEGSSSKSRFLPLTVGLHRTFPSDFTIK